MISQIFRLEILVKGDWGQIVVCDIGFGMNLINNLPPDV